MAYEIKNSETINLSENELILKTNNSIPEFQTCISKCITKLKNKNMGDKLNKMTIILSDEKCIYTYSTGINEYISTTNSTGNNQSYLSLNLVTNQINLNINIDEDNNYEIIYGTEKNKTSGNDVICWKGGYYENKQPCIVKLIIPKEGKIYQSENEKFRTNMVYIEKIYRVNYVSCYMCKKWGIYNCKNLRLCRGHARMLYPGEKEFILMDFEKKENEIKKCNAPFQFNFEYKTGDTLDLKSLDKKSKKCDKEGYYFFFDKELIFGYVLYDCWQPIENKKPLSKEFIEKVQSEIENKKNTTTQQNNNVDGCIIC
jgi:hypothetical protein